MKLAVQLYTLRGQVKSGQDLLNILGKVRDIGFAGVEFAGFFDLPAAAVKARLDELGLEAAGMHLSFDELSGAKLAQSLDYAAAIGSRYIGTGGHSTRKEEDMQTILTVMGEAARQAEQRGMIAYYHNHSHEFKRDAQGIKLDRIKQVCPLELDTYWSFFAKVDTPAYLRQNAERIKLVHIKDGGKRFPKPKALGEGKNDLLGIIAATRDIGCEWLILENDFPKPDGLSDITRSMAYLKKYATE